MIIQLTLTITLLLSLTGLGIDGVRWFILRQQIAAVTNAAASSAAKQLTQKSGCGCVANATSAANQIIAANTSALSDSFTTFGQPTVTFYSSLNPPTPTTTDTAAQFVGVSLNGQTQALFPFTPLSSLSVSATALD